MDKHFCPYCMSPVPEGETCPVCGLTSGAYVPSPHHLPPGTVLMDRYLVGRVLGEGGFGITYIGCDLRLEMKVAIKEYYPVDRATRNAAVSLAVTSFMGAAAKSYARGKQKFLGEARIMAKMDKQQEIVSVRDFFEANNTAYIVMEYVEGITLKELVEKKGGRIAPEELFPMVKPLFSALSRLHELGLIHRDISPDNLMLENGKIRLLDFGCAREAGNGSETMTITLKHGYAPIEQYFSAGKQGPWTDVYALSATLYYCLVGETPPQALERKLGLDPLVPPSKRGVKLPEKVEKGLLKGLIVEPDNRAPNDRIKTMQELYEALYDKEPDDEDPDPPKPKKPLLGYAVALALFLLCAGLGIWQASLAGGPKMSEVLQGGVLLMDYSDGHGPDELQNAFWDEDVSTVLIHESMYTERLTVTKPLRIEKGAELFCDNLTLTGDGKIQVEGFFQTRYLRLEGGSSFHAFETAALDLDGAVIWADRDGQFLVDDPEVEEAARDMAIFVTLDPEPDEALSVSSPEELDRLVNDRANRGKVLSVDGDLSLEGDYNLSQPLYIPEGSRFSISGTLNLDEGGALLNRGTLNGSLYTNTGAPLLNLGQVGSSEDPFSFWLEGGSALVNEGEAWFDFYSRIWIGGRFINQLSGTVNAVDLILANGSMDNYGALQAISGCDGLMIASGGWLTNYGTLTIQPDSQLRNFGYIENRGQLTWCENSRINNVYLENTGHLIRSGDCVIEQLGAVFGTGEFFNMDVLPYIHVNGIDEPSDAVPVSTAEDFLRELELGSGDIRVEGEVTVQLSKDYALAKARTIYVAGTLVLDGPGTLTVTHSRIYLLNGWAETPARLDFNTNIILQNSSELRMEGDTTLGGSQTLTLDHSIFRGWGGNLNTGGATLRLQNQALSVVTPFRQVEGGCSFSIAGGSVFVLPFVEEGDLYRESFTVEDAESSLLHTGAGTMTDCTLDIQGQFLTCGWDLQLDNCQVTVGRQGADNGAFRLIASGMTVRGDSTITNWGTVWLDSWNEFTLNLAYNDPEGLVNYGDFWIGGIRSQFENDAGIRNEGHMSFSARDGFDVSRITGRGRVEMN